MVGKLCPHCFGIYVLFFGDGRIGEDALNEKKFHFITFYYNCDLIIIVIQWEI